MGRIKNSCPPATTETLLLGTPLLPILFRDSEVLAHSPSSLGPGVPALSSIHGSPEKLRKGAPRPVTRPAFPPKNSIDNNPWIKPHIPGVSPRCHLPLIQLCFRFLPPGREKGRCVASEYFLEPEINLVTENTENILSEGKQGASTKGVVLGERAAPGKGWGWRGGSAVVG